jgi:Cys-tRNA(Pro) deacylase
MGKKKKQDRYPITMGVRQLREHDAVFEPRLYTYVERGGTRVSSEELGVPEHSVIKTLIFEDQDGEPLVILQHGDREVAPGLLAKAIGQKSTRPCLPEVAQKHTGYLVGGTSPFGIKTAMPIYAEETIFDLEHICINAGKRGFLIEISTAELDRVLQPTRVAVAQPDAEDASDNAPWYTE